MQGEMSCAGDPAAITALGKQIMTLINQQPYLHNIPSLDNIEYALQRVAAEVRQVRRVEYKRQHPTQKQ